MMKLVALTILFCTSLYAFGQEVDSSAILYASPVSSPSIESSPSSPALDKTLEDGMEKNRYIKRPSVPVKKIKTRVATPVSEEDESLNISDKNSVSPLPKLSPDSFDVHDVPQPKPEIGSEYTLGFGQRLRDMVLGGDPEQIQNYRYYLDAGDIRKNIFEFTLATSYMYNTSSSPYYFRNYINASPGAFLGIDLWLTPFFAIDGDYRFSLLSALKDSPTQEVFISASHSWFNLGFKFRRFFGFSRKAPSLTLGLRYSDYSLNVPPNSVSRLPEHTTGPELSLEVNLPSKRFFSWNLGVKLLPFLTHTESILSNDVRTGQSNQTLGLGAHVGGEYQFTRQTRVFFKLSALLYKSQFSGISSGIDPITGTSASGVSVNNAFYILDLGINLGR